MESRSPRTFSARMANRATPASRSLANRRSATRARGRSFAAFRARTRTAVDRTITARSTAAFTPASTASTPPTLPNTERA